MRRQREKGKFVDGPFIPLTLGVKQSAAWAALSMQARLIYLELRGKLARDPRENNGRVHLSVRDACDAIGIVKLGTGSAAFHELQAKGFIVVTRLGTLGSEGKGKATDYRITECGTRYAYEGTKDYLRWQPGHDFTVHKGKTPTRPKRAPRVVAIDGKRT